MKKIMIIMAALALISVSVFAGSVELKTSGPSGQGDLIWWAPSSGVTNLVMTTNGISVFNVATGAAVLTNATVSIETGAITATAIITPQLDTNGIMTNATCAVTIVGGDAVVTNVVLSNP